MSKANKNGTNIKVPVGSGKLPPKFKYLIILTISIFISELLIMLVLALFPPLPNLYESILDASLLTTIISPILYFFAYLPLSNQLQKLKTVKSELQKARDNLEEMVIERTQQLDQSEKKLRTLYNASPDAIMLLNENGFVDCNRSTLDLFRVPSLQQFITYHPSQLSPEYQRDGGLSAKGANEKIKIAYQKGSNHFEWLHRRIDGTVFDAEVILKRVEIEKKTLLQATVRDISKRKNIERQQHTIYDISQAAGNSTKVTDLIRIIREKIHPTIDTTNFYVAIYDNLHDLYSIPIIYGESEEEETILQKDMRKSLTDYVRRRGEAIIINQEKFSSLVATGEVIAIGKPTACWMGVPLKADAKTFGVIVVQDYNNIDAFTENDIETMGYFAQTISTLLLRKKAEEDMRRAKTEAEKVSKLKSEFIATMSHEIRTPMNGVLAMTDLLQETELNKTQKEYANTIHDSAESLLHIINDILDFSKIEAGKIIPGMQEFDLFALIENVLAFFQPEASRKKIKLLKKTETNIPPRINSDPFRLRQILTNLIGNAIKFTAEGSVCLSVKQIEDNPERMVIRFEITDTGIGIKPETVQHLFNPFSQADSSTTRKYGGTGLGLVISKRLTELLGGQITLNSIPGHGSTFCFTISSQKKLGAHYPQPAFPAPVSEGETAIPNQSHIKMRVLLADDNRINQKVASIILQKTGCMVEVVSDGREAVAAWRGKNYDMILMDLQMPDMDGISATKVIREEEAPGSHIPIIALTANAIKGVRESCMSAGMDDFLTKPFRKNELIQIIMKFTVPQNETAPQSNPPQI